MKKYHFPQGGLVYEDEYAPLAISSTIACIPAVLVVPLMQHSGIQAIPVVSVGDTIHEGMVIGRAESKGSSNVHSPIPGRIVRMVRWRMSDGRESDAFVIRLSGSFQKLGKRPELFSWNGLSVHELQRMIAEKGVVETEEPGRPVNELLSHARNSNRRNVLVLNAVIDDPWLASEKVLLAERQAAVAEGVAIAMKVAAISQVLIAVAFNDRKVVEPLVSLIEKFDVKATIVLVGSKYPQRNNRELFIALSAFTRNHSIEYDDFLLFNLSTTAAIFDAARYNQPMLERYISVGGASVKHPAVLRVRIGTRIGDAIAECGGFIEEASRIIIGSPLRGRAVFDLDTPITKTTQAVVALSAEQLGNLESHACISCGNCRTVCPVGLDPERLHKLSVLGRYKEAVDEGAADCHGCSCCAVVCPSRLPLRTTIMLSAERRGGRA